MYDSKQTLVGYITIITDLFTMFVVYLLANYIKFGNFRTGINNPEDYYLGVYTTTFMCYLIVYFFTSSQKDMVYRNWIQEAFDVARMEIYIAALTIGYYFSNQTSWYYSRVQMGLYFTGSVIGVFVTRQMLKRYILKSYHRSGSNEKIMLVTTYDQVEPIMRKVKQTRNWYFRISNLAIVDKDVVREEIEDLEVVANKETLVHAASVSEIDTVLFYVDESIDIDYKKLINEIRAMGKNVRMNIGEYGYSHGERELEFLGNIPVVSFTTKHYRIRYMAIKRMFDIFCALVGMALFIPVYIIMAVGFILEGDPGNIIIQTLRVGKNGRRFYMLRFRTIRKKGLEKIPKDKTPQYSIMGRIIKFFGLENLPNAWNILWGNMSVVGVNAPTLDEFLGYSQDEKRKMTLKPGMIGLWQVQNKHYTKEQSDEHYVNHWSLMMDGGIIIKTLKMFVAK